MKKILFIALLLLSGCFFTAYSGRNALAQDNDTEQDTVVQDTMVNVIGWFLNHDTVDYWIEQTRGRFTPQDTVKTARTSMKVRVTVVDSTQTGYKMDYTVLDFRVEHIKGSKLSEFQENVVEKFGDKLVGMTVRFETNEFGQITKITNLEELIRTVVPVYKDILNEIRNTPEAKELTKVGLNIDNILNSIDDDRMVEDLIAELNMLFVWHGSAFTIGTAHVHEPATDTEYESDTYTTAVVDPDEDIYSIENEVVSIIPARDIVGMFSLLFDMSGSDIDKLNNMVGGSDNHGGIYRSDVEFVYFFDGWPASAMKQDMMVTTGYGQVKQTNIYMTYCASREK